MSLKYTILYQNESEDIFTRLLKIRNIEDDILDFLNPSFAKYRNDPFLFEDMQKSIQRIKTAIEKDEKIMIFGDYDVDGITSSFLIYSFFTKFLKYKNISIRLPNRFEEGYGMRKTHIDEINDLGVKLIITVDNGITAFNEIDYANSLGIDIIVTDHHKPLEKIPQAFGLIDPHASEGYGFKYLAGVGVAFKFITAISSAFSFDDKTKKLVMDYYLPVVAIGTVADCVPLVNENRLFVKRGLELLNGKKNLPKSIANLIDYLNIKTKITSFHIGFMIAPRLNASGRLVDPYQSLNCLLYSDFDKQSCHLKKMEELNTQRRKLQEDTFKLAEQDLDSSQNIIISSSTEYSEGIIGLVAGRLTEKYNKPSAVICINEEKQLATASLRGPEYFDIVEMLNQAGEHLLNYGGHKQAGGMSFELSKMEVVTTILYDFCQRTIIPEENEKVIKVDTILSDEELDESTLSQIESLAPFGEGNPEPVFLIQGVEIYKVDKVGKNGNGHLKLHAKKGDNLFHILFWGKGALKEGFDTDRKYDIIGKIKNDDFNGGFYIDGMELI